MLRPIFKEVAIHPTIRASIAGLHQDLSQQEQVQSALAQHACVVAGMSGNLMVGSARKALDAAGVPHEFLELGSCFSAWHGATR
jgi:monothiol glutaredoxin